MSETPEGSLQIPHALIVTSVVTRRGDESCGEEEEEEEKEEEEEEEEEQCPRYREGQYKHHMQSS